MHGIHLIVIIHPAATSLLIIRQTLLITHDVFAGPAIMFSERRRTSILTTDQSIRKLWLVNLQPGGVVMVCWERPAREGPAVCVRWDK